MSDAPGSEETILRASPVSRSGREAAFTLRSAPAENRGFAEGRRYAIERPGPGWSFRVDDEPLRDAADDPPAWLWEPSFYAGEVTAELRRPDGRVSALFLLDVEADPAKAGRDTFNLMLEELWAEDPTLVVGSEPATRQIGELGEQQDPLLALARLRRHGDAFQKALEAVCARPRRQLVATREDVALHRVRRVDRQTARAAVRTAGVASMFAGAGSLGGSFEDLRLDVPRVEETYDCAANRCLLALARGVERRVRGLVARLQRAVEAERQNDARTPLTTRWPARREFLEGLSAGLGAICRRMPFRAVRRAEVTASGLNAVSADPLYARAWTSGWRSVRNGLDGPLMDERTWISPTWEVYERWCFVKLGTLLRDGVHELMWERLEQHPTHATAAWRGRSASGSIELLLQPKFPGGGRRIAAHGFWSVSGHRVPDLLVHVRDERGERFVVLDAKYRASRENVLDAMSSAHIYQDSLRLDGRRPEGALLLVPAGGGAVWLENPSFQEEHRVGVHPLNPRDTQCMPGLCLRVLGLGGALGPG